MNLSKYTVVIILFGIISCSSNDVPDPNPEPEILEISKLEHFNNDSEGNHQVKFETFFEDGKILSVARYDMNNTQVNHTNYSYDDKNRLIKTQKFESSLLEEEKTIHYDSNGRIVKVEHRDFSTEYNQYTNEFVYDSDHIISAFTTNFYGNVFALKYRLNSQGLVIEELLDDEVMTSVQYQGVNTVQKIDQVSEINYTYLENSQNPLTIYYKIFGDQLFNLVLFHNNLDHVSDYYAEKLIKQRDWEEHVGFFQRNEYEFNENGQPINMKIYYKDEVEERFSDEYIYYYD